MFCEESLRKIKFRAFPKSVGPRILSLESVDYFGTGEHYWVVENNNNHKTAKYFGNKSQFFVLEAMSQMFGWQYNTIQYNSIKCKAMQCNAMQCNTIQ